MKFKQKVVLFTLALVLALSLGVSASAQSTLDVVKARGVLVAGVKFDAPPFGFINEKGEPVGFDIDVARYIADKLGVKLQLKQVTSQTRIPMLLEGQVDMLVATMTHQRARDEAIDFSITYFFADQRLLVKKGSGIKSVDDLVGKTVATVQGSTSEINIRKAQPKANVLTFQEYPQAFLAVQQGRAHAMTTDASILVGFAGPNPDYEIVGPSIAPEPYGIGVRENDSKFRDAINFAIMDMWISGDYHKVYDKWFGPDSGYYLPMTGAIEVWP